jgi:phospholipid/cholesterol/gamma-HCH transport system substrate-binding protein
MKYSNEIKVGLALLASVAIFYAGLRYLQDISIFKSSYPMQVEFDEANGLVSGNPVELKGVNVGSVESVRLDQQRQKVVVRFRVEEDVTIPEGSYAEASGFSALSGVRLSITPGPSSNPALEPGSTLQPPPGGDVLERLSDQAPELATKLDSTLTNADRALGGIARLVQDSSSAVNGSLRNLEATLANLERATNLKQNSVRDLVANLEAISADLRTFTGESSDTLSLAAGNLNRSLARLDRNLAALETTTASLNEVVAKMNNGEGTFGRLLNDPSLYIRLDTTAARTNRLLLDVQRNPRRYLEDMTLVKVF